MPVGHSAQCRACNSKHRADIDGRLLAGESTRAVARWLDTLGEKVTHQALSNHRAEHLDARAEAAARVEAAAPVFEAGVARIIADVSVLDEVAAIALRTARALEPLVLCEKPATSTAAAFAAALSNARAAVTDRHELLHGKKVDLGVSGLADFLGQAFRESGEGEPEGGTGPVA